VAARFKCNGTDEASIANPLEPDTGSGYKLIPSGTGITYETSQFYEGTSSIVGNDSDYLYLGDGSGGYISAVATPAFYVDFFWRCSSLPGSDTMIFGSTYLGEFGAYVTSTGRLRFKASGTTSGESATGLLTANAWHRLRFQHNTTNGLIEAYVWTTNLTVDDPTGGIATQVLPTADLNGLYVLFGIPTASTFFYDDIVVQPVSEGDPTHAAGATTHSADATRATTATISAAASVARPTTASLATAATIAAGATREASSAATLATVASITAEASVVRSAQATLAATATITSDGTVATPGQQGADATLAAAAAIVAEASVIRGASASLAATATLSADGAVVTPGQHSGVASLDVTASISAAASVTRSATATLGVTASLTAVGLLPNEATRGLMAPLDLARATMTPITGVGNLPRRMSLRSIDTVTMTALASLTEIPGVGGLPVFIGGDESPQAAGLIAAGLPYLWISDGVVYYEDGS
jgi:hypothetical protein